VRERGIGNVSFLEADIFALPFEQDRFDDVFVCFLLEHLADPLDALGRLRDVLKLGGTMTVIEGDHGSAFFYPDSPHGCE
jgi:ubiquinone/menaquinone biosynthesis C-methylase UbiE